MGRVLLVSIFFLRGKDMSRALSLALLAGMPIAMVGCSGTPETRTEAANWRIDAQEVLEKATNRDPTLQPLLDRSAGYAVLPYAGQGGALVGVGAGQGVLYERGQITGYVNMSQASIGAVLGGQEFSEIIVFETPRVLQEFKEGPWTMSGEASAVAIESGAASKTSFRDNVAVFMYAEKGLMANASLGTQKFSFTPVGEARPAGAEIEADIDADVEDDMDVDVDVD